MLEGVVWETAEKAGVRPGPLPAWLWRGLAGNLDAGLRARNSEMVLARWQRGQVISPAELLGNGTGARPAVGTAEEADHRAACGLWVKWLLSLPNGRRLFSDLLRHVGEGGTATPDWLILRLPGCASSADLDEQWDKWILRQRRVVYRPGEVTRQVVDQLRGELLLYPGQSGIPLNCGSPERIELHELIDRRGSPWIPAFVRGKCASLRVLAIGRGEEFGAVVESYCRFLTGLPGRSSKKRLTQLLQKARRDLRELAAGLEEARAQ